MRADEEENNIGVPQSFVNLAPPFCSWGDKSVVPLADHVLTVERDELTADVVHQRLVLVRIREEHLDWP